VSAPAGRAAVVAALSANLGIAVMKFVAFLVTGSSAMLAEAVHSFADSGNQVLLLVGARRANRAATVEHPFGYGRSRYLYAFVVAVVLFSVGGLFALYEGWHKLAHPEPITDGYWAVGVLAGAIGLESLSLRTAVKESNPLRGEQSWMAFIRHAKAPELPVILLEDVGALAGLLLAFGCVVMSIVTGNGVWDGVGSIAIGVLLVTIAMILGVETKSLLLGESASLADREAIARALVSQDQVERVIHMKTLHLGPDELLVAAKIAVPAHASAAEIAVIIDRTEAAVRQVVPIARVIYLEPDIDRGREATETHLP
jgi:cation diffusion facilitator family transporter